MAEPVIHESGGGEVIDDRDVRRIAILADIHELVVTESRYAAGVPGPEPHVHHGHVDAFYVLEGTLAFGIGPQISTELLAAPGTFALVPPEVVHTFWSPGPGDARFLNIHAPGSVANFAALLRASRDGREPTADFDTDDPPADGGLPASNAIVRGPGEGDMATLGPSTVLFKAEGGDGGGRFSLTETTLAPGAQGPVPHRHAALVDSFYVLEGTLAVRLGDETREAPAGSFALVPPGAVHTFSNPGDEPARMLNLMAPAGFERSLKEAARLAGEGPPDPTLMAEVASRYDFHPAE